LIPLLLHLVRSKKTKHRNFSETPVLLVQPFLSILSEYFNNNTI